MALIIIGIILVPRLFMEDPLIGLIAAGVFIALL